jgi:hypothetical protein
MPELIDYRIAVSKHVPLAFKVPAVPPLRPYLAEIGEEWNELYRVPVGHHCPIPTRGDLAPGVVLDGNPSDMLKPRVKDVTAKDVGEDGREYLVRVAQIHRFEELNNGDD